MYMYIHLCKYMYTYIVACSIHSIHALLFELCQYTANVAGGGEAYHDVQLFQLHVNGVVVFDEEHFDVLFQNVRPAGNWNFMFI